RDLVVEFQVAERRRKHRAVLDDHAMGARRLDNALGKLSPARGGDARRLTRRLVIGKRHRDAGGGRPPLAAHDARSTKRPGGVCGGSSGANGWHCTVSSVRPLASSAATSTGRSCVNRASVAGFSPDRNTLMTPLRQLICENTGPSSGLST